MSQEENYANIFLSVLKENFESRKKKNPNYSLRSFARFLKLGPSTLSEILSQKKALSDKTARNVAQALGLRGSSKDIFVLSAVVYRTKNLKVKQEAIEKISLLSKRPTHYLEGEELDKVNSWIQFALMELMTFSDFDHSPAWLAKKLSMAESAVIEQLNLLCRIQWIEKNENGYSIKFNSNSAESSNDISSEAIKKYHQSILKKAAISLESDAVLDREFQSIVLGFNPKRMADAKKMIRGFVDQFNIAFAHDPQKKEVIQLSVQLFSLSR